MDFFTKNKYAAWTIVILVLLNLFTLGTLWMKQFMPPPLLVDTELEKPRDVQKFLKKELNLDDNQIEKFEESRREHFEQTREIHEDIQRLKREMVSELFNSEPDTAKMNALAHEIGQKQIKLEKLFSSHFLGLKSVCGVDQRHKLRGLLHDYLMRGEPRVRRPGIREGRIRD